jgi:hypothetical protein
VGLLRGSCSLGDLDQEVLTGALELELPELDEVEPDVFEPDADEPPDVEVDELLEVPEFDDDELEAASAFFSAGLPAPADFSRESVR